MWKQIVEELADAPTPDGTARGAPEAEPAQEDGRFPTIYEESEADLGAHIVEVWCTELPKGEKELWEATPLEDLFTVPTHMTPDNSVLITVAEEQRGHLPM
eukprot:3244835-Pyramimonas_sp.AAC.1